VCVCVCVCVHVSVQACKRACERECLPTQTDCVQHYFALNLYLYTYYNGTTYISLLSNVSIIFALAEHTLFVRFYL